MKCLGLDLGSRTLGMAISDKDGIVATSLKTVRHDEDYKGLTQVVLDVVKSEKIEKVVLGLPKNMNGTIGFKGELSMKFKDMLLEVLPCEVVLEDERLTTKLATSVLIKGDVSRKKRKNVIDSLAATFILQGYLDRNRK